MDKWYCNENGTSYHHKCPEYAACLMGVCIVKSCQVNNKMA